MQISGFCAFQFKATFGPKKRGYTDIKGGAYIRGNTAYVYNINHGKM